MDNQWVGKGMLCSQGHTLMSEGVMCLARWGHSTGREVFTTTPEMV